MSFIVKGIQWQLLPQLGKGVDDIRCANTDHLHGIGEMHGLSLSCDVMITEHAAAGNNDTTIGR